MRVFLLLISSFLFSTDFQSVEIISTTATASLATIDAFQLTNKQPSAATPKPRKKPDSEKVKDIWTDQLRGMSGKKDADENYLPPFTKTEITYYLDAKPLTDEKITVIPLGGAVAPFELKIIAAKRIEQECDGSFVWETKFEPITDKEILAMKTTSEMLGTYLVEAFVIYPAVAHPALISNEKLTKAMLPKGILTAKVEVAVDTDQDGKPDLLLTGDKSFKKVGGEWQILKQYLDEEC